MKTTDLDAESARRPLAASPGTVEVDPQRLTVRLAVATDFVVEVTQ